MKIQRKLFLVILVLLLISTGIVAAQSSANFIMQRFAVVGGGTADSTNYSVTSVFGQPTIGVFNSSNYEVTAGFLQSVQNNKVWVPIILK